MKKQYVSDVTNTTTIRNINDQEAVRFHAFIIDGKTALHNVSEGMFAFGKVASAVCKAYDGKGKKGYSVRAYAEAVGVSKSTVSDAARVYSVFGSRSDALTARLSYSVCRELSRHFTSASKAVTWMKKHDFNPTTTVKAVQTALKADFPSGKVQVNSDISDKSASEKSHDETIREALGAVADIMHIMKTYQLGVDDADGIKVVNRLTFLQATLKSLYE